MNFGQIRERFENEIGSTVNAATLGGWIDAAQLEIAMLHGGTRIWYPPPNTYTAEQINASATSVLLADSTQVSDAPNTVILGDGETYEYITYESISSGSLVELQRGTSGTTARIWPLGTGVRILPLADVEYDMPDDVITLHEIRDTNNNPYFRYQLSKDNKIAFFDSGMYYLSITQTPDPIDYTDNAAEPVVHTAFHVYIVQYCVASYWDTIAEGIPNEENKAQTKMQNFQKSIEKMAKKLNRVPNQQYTIGINLWDGR